MPISATLTDAQRDLVLAKIDEIEAALPFLVDLDSDDVAALPKLGDRSLPFTERSLALARQDDSFLPRKFDLDEFARDLALYQALDSLIHPLTSLLELIKDTRVLAGSDAYAAALDVYHAAKRAGKGSGLDSVLNEVGKRFAQRPSNSAGPSTTSP
jgi:hypothetical protein